MLYTFTQPGHSLASLGQSNLYNSAFLVSPADGPYNMTYVIGDYGKISWHQQTQIDHDSGMTNRRLPVQNTGGAYQPPE